MKRMAFIALIGLMSHGLAMANDSESLPDVPVSWSDDSC